MKKGFTLIELLAVLVVLGLLSIIVIPQVSKNISDSKITICSEQLLSLKSAAKNWLTDKIDNDYYTVFNEDNTFIAQKVTGQDLLDNGYVATIDDAYKGINVIITLENNNYVFTIPNEKSICK